MVAREAMKRGVGGWLLLLTIGLIVFGPLGAIVTTMNALNDAERHYPSIAVNSAWHNYKLASWTIIAASCVISVAAGYRLCKDFRPESVRFAVWALWLRGPVVSVLDAFSTNIFLGLSLSEYFLDEKLIAQNIVVMVIALIWTLYLKFSRRVRNTYYERPSLEGVFR